jgi:hypothetical protein
MTSEMWSRHPASIILQWYAFAEKDEDGYAPLSSLVECLKVKCGIESPIFLERISSSEWQKNYGWRLKFHAWKPNRVKLTRDDCNQELKKHRTQETGPCICTLIASSTKRLQQVEGPVSFAPRPSIYVLHAGRGKVASAAYSTAVSNQKAGKKGGQKTSPIPSRQPPKFFAVPKGACEE